MRLLKITMFVAAALLSYGCKWTSGGSASGKPYEVLLVMNEANWNGAPGDTLRSIMMEEVPYLNQPEPFFDIYHVVPQRFKGAILNYRNVVIYDISPVYTTAADTVERNVHVTPQTIIRIQAPSHEKAVAYMSENREKIQNTFLKSEKNFFLTRIKRNPNTIVDTEVKRLFGIDMTVPAGYKIRNSTDDFLWLSHELRELSQGIIIYKFPVPQSEEENLLLLEKRNEFVKRIPGPSDGSYMTTSKAFPPFQFSENINGQPWAVMRGFWDVEGDFMGGPFSNYTTFDMEQNQLIAIDMYVYSPGLRKGKRNYIWELESLMETVKLPEYTGTVEEKYKIFQSVEGAEK